MRTIDSTPWRKSTYSQGVGTECVEVASAPGRVLVADTKQRDRAARTVVAFTPAAWRRFTASLR